MDESCTDLRRSTIRKHKYLNNQVKHFEEGSGTPGQALNKESQGTLTRGRHRGITLLEL
jgi:hypothetical protein